MFIPQRTQTFNEPTNRIFQRRHPGAVQRGAQYLVRVGCEDELTNISRDGRSYDSALRCPGTTVWNTRWQSSERFRDIQNHIIWKIKGLILPVQWSRP